MMLCHIAVFASGKDEPPVPTQRVPPGPGLVVPIDSDIWILLVIGILLGLWKFYKHQSTPVNS